VCDVIGSQTLAQQTEDFCFPVGEIAEVVAGCRGWAGKPDRAGMLEVQSSKRESEYVDPRLEQAALSFDSGLRTGLKGSRRTEPLGRYCGADWTVKFIRISESCLSTQLSRPPCEIGSACWRKTSLAYAAPRVDLFSLRIRVRMWSMTDKDIQMVIYRKLILQSFQGAPFSAACQRVRCQNAMQGLWPGIFCGWLGCAPVVVDQSTEYSVTSDRGVE
jgi:hypothetical protein